LRAVARFARTAAPSTAAFPCVTCYHHLHRTRGRAAPLVCARPLLHLYRLRTVYYHHTPAAGFTAVYHRGSCTTSSFACGSTHRGLVLPDTHCHFLPLRLHAWFCFFHALYYRACLYRARFIPRLSAFVLLPFGCFARTTRLTVCRGYGSLRRCVACLYCAPLYTATDVWFGFSFGSRFARLRTARTRRARTRAFACRVLAPRTRTLPQFFTFYRILPTWIPACRDAAGLPPALPTFLPLIRTCLHSSLPVDSVTTFVLPFCLRLRTYYLPTYAWLLLVYAFARTLCATRSVPAFAGWVCFTFPAFTATHACPHYLCLCRLGWILHTTAFTRAAAAGRVPRRHHRTPYVHTFSAYRTTALWVHLLRHTVAPVHHAAPLPVRMRLPFLPHGCLYSSGLPIFTRYRSGLLLDTAGSFAPHGYRVL